MKHSELDLNQLERLMSLKGIFLIDARQWEIGQLERLIKKAAETGSKLIILNV